MIATVVLSYAFYRFLPEYPFMNRVGWCFVAGIVFFSGSLYLLAVTGVTILGAVTPIGGLLFLAGWACLAFAAI